MFVKFSGLSKCNLKQKYEVILVLPKSSLLHAEYICWMDFEAVQTTADQALTFQN